MKINENFIPKKIDNNYVFIPIGQEAIDIMGLLKTNEIGYAIYNYLLEGKNIDEISDSISKEYNAPVEVVKKDCLEFIELMKKYKVVL